ncbi:MAG: hypothetical protein HZB41_14660 [Ignavibacteriae bacterium]|nr:hypothetical protein [Ignavibacteriota bacterium]
MHDNPSLTHDDMYKFQFRIQHSAFIIHNFLPTSSFVLRASFFYLLFSFFYSISSFFQLPASFFYLLPSFFQLPASGSQLNYEL